MMLRRRLDGRQSYIGLRQLFLCTISSVHHYFSTYLNIWLARTHVIIEVCCGDTRTVPIATAIALQESRVRVCVQEKREGKASAINLFLKQGRSPIVVIAIAHALGRELPAGSIPLWLAHLASDLFTVLPGMRGERAPLTRSRVKFLTNSRIYDIRRAKSELDYTPAVALQEG